MNFIELIKQNIKPGQIIENKSYDNMIRVDEYKYLGATQFECFLLNMNTNDSYSVSERDFQFLFENWEQYKTGKISRSSLVAKNKKTTYAICLFYYLDENHLLEN